MKHLTTALFLFSAAAPALAQDETMGVRVREWFARMSGTAEAQDNNSNFTKVDLADDLGLGNRNLTTEIQAYLHLPVLGRLYAGWWRAHDSGSEDLMRTVEFAGQSFSVSTEVDSQFTLDVGYLTYEFDLPTIPIGSLVKLELGVSAGVRVIRGEGSISGGGQSASDSGVVGLPTLGAHATAKFFDFVRAEVEVLGLVFKYANNKVEYLEMFGEATVEPLPWVFAGVGYKLAEVKLDHGGSNRFDIHLDISGIYVTAGVRF
jgi:hypothetical protein